MRFVISLFRLFRVQEKQDESEREDTIEKFKNSTSGILLCTQAASEDLEIGPINSVIQYDPPCDVE